MSGKINFPIPFKSNMPFIGNLHIFRANGHEIPLEYEYTITFELIPDQDIQKYVKRVPEGFVTADYNMQTNGIINANIGIVDGGNIIVLTDTYKHDDCFNKECDTCEIDEYLSNLILNNTTLRLHLHIQDDDFYYDYQTNALISNISFTYNKVYISEDEFYYSCSISQMTPVQGENKTFTDFNSSNSWTINKNTINYQAKGIWDIDNIKSVNKLGAANDVIQNNNNNYIWQLDNDTVGEYFNYYKSNSTIKTTKYYASKTNKSRDSLMFFPAALQNAINNNAISGIELLLAQSTYKFNNITNYTIDVSAFTINTLSNINRWNFLGTWTGTNEYATLYVEFGYYNQSNVYTVIETHEYGLTAKIKSFSIDYANKYIGSVVSFGVKLTDKDGNPATAAVILQSFKITLKNENISVLSSEISNIENIGYYAPFVKFKGQFISESVSTDFISTDTLLLLEKSNNCYHYPTYNTNIQLIAKSHKPGELGLLPPADELVYKLLYVESDEYVSSGKQPYVSFEINDEAKTNYGRVVPCALSFGVESQTEGFYQNHIKFYIKYSNDVELLIGALTVKTQIIGEDERYRTLFANFGIPDPKQYSNIFADSDYMEEGTDYKLINQKSKELMLSYDEIFKKAGSYKALLNAVKFLGYTDLVFKEQIRLLDADNTETDVNYQVFDVSTGEIYKPLLKNYGISPNEFTSYTKLNKLSMIYHLNELSGKYEQVEYQQVNAGGLGSKYTLYTDDALLVPVLKYMNNDVLFKLYAVRKWLEKYVIGVNAKIVDIVGEALYIYNTNVITTPTTHLMNDVSDKVNHTANLQIITANNTSNKIDTFLHLSLAESENANTNTSSNNGVINNISGNLTFGDFTNESFNSFGTSDILNTSNIRLNTPEMEYTISYDGVVNTSVNRPHRVEKASNPALAVKLSHEYVHNNNTSINANIYINPSEPKDSSFTYDIPYAISNTFQIPIVGNTINYQLYTDIDDIIIYGYYQKTKTTSTGEQTEYVLKSIQITSSGLELLDGEIESATIDPAYVGCNIKEILLYTKKAYISDAALYDELNVSTSNNNDNNYNDKPYIIHKINKLTIIPPHFQSNGHPFYQMNADIVLFDGSVKNADITIYDGYLRLLTNNTTTDNNNAYNQQHEYVVYYNEPVMTFDSSNKTPVFITHISSPTVNISNISGTPEQITDNDIRQPRHHIENYYNQIINDRLTKISKSLPLDMNPAYLDAKTFVESKEFNDELTSYEKKWKLKDAKIASQCKISQHFDDSIISNTSINIKPLHNGNYQLRTSMTNSFNHVYMSESNRVKYGITDINVVNTAGTPQREAICHPYRPFIKCNFILEDVIDPATGKVISQRPAIKIIGVTTDFKVSKYVCINNIIHKDEWNSNTFERIDKHTLRRINETYDQPIDNNDYFTECNINKGFLDMEKAAQHINDTDIFAVRKYKDISIANTIIKRPFITQMSGSEIKSSPDSIQWAAQSLVKYICEVDMDNITTINYRYKDNRLVMDVIVRYDDPYKIHKAIDDNHYCVIFYDYDPNIANKYIYDSSNKAKGIKLTLVNGSIKKWTFYIKPIDKQEKHIIFEHTGKSISIQYNEEGIYTYDVEYFINGNYNKLTDQSITF